MKFSEFLESRGGQLFAIYLLILAAGGFSFFDQKTGITILNMLIGAVLRDMQDKKS